MKTLFYIKLFCLLTLSSLAQNLYIKGAITDKKTSHPIKKAKVSLYNYKDSLVYETFSDKNGLYSLLAGGNDNYYMLVYEKKYSKKKVVFGATSQSIDNGNITLNKKATHHAYFSWRPNRYSLKVIDLKPIEKNGTTSWRVKTTLKNRTFHTLYYFSSTDCESSNYSVMALITDTLGLTIDFEKCDLPKQTVIAVRPFKRRTTELEIKTQRQATSSFEFKVILFLPKAKNIDERIPKDEFIRKRVPLIVSNTIKT